MNIREIRQQEFANAFLSKVRRVGILLLSTRFGKCRVGLNILELLPGHLNVLVCYPENTIKDSWEEEIVKTHFNQHRMTFTNFRSLDKYMGAKFDAIITDECFSGETELLTDGGFVRFDNLSGIEKVAQWEDGKITFVVPEKYIERCHVGKMNKFHIKDGIDVPMTPNHEQIFVNKNGETKKTKISETRFSPSRSIVVSGKSTFIDSGQLSYLEKLYIATQADGSIHTIATDHVTIAFSFSKERKIERFLELCKNSGLQWNEVKGDNTRRRWMVRMPLGTTKIISNHIDFPISSVKAQKVIDEMVEWDGSKVQGGTQFYYSSVEKQNVDFYSAVATLAGHSCYQSTEVDNRKESYKDVHRLSITLNKSLRDTQQMSVSEYFYNGKVYCVKVPSGAIVVRHKGYTFISGNCHALSEAQIAHLQALQTGCDIVLGLTGTLSKWSEKALKSKLGWPVIARYTQEQAILDGIVSDYEITVHTIPLDNQRLIQYKKKLNTEKKQFGAYSFVIEKMEKGDKDTMFLRLARMRIIQSSLAKTTLTRRLLAKYKDERVLVFCGIKAIADNLGIPSDHSGKKDSGEAILQFKDGLGNHLAVCKMASMGVTFKPLDRVIINYFDSNSENLQQRIARATNLDYNGKIAKIDIICTTEQVELDWLKRALKPFNNSKINYV